MLAQTLFHASCEERSYFKSPLRVTALSILAFFLLLPVSLTPTRAETPFLLKPAPDFALASSTGLNLRLSEFRGDVVVMNFWSIRCGQCRTQLDWLVGIDAAQCAGQECSKHMSILSINVDGDSGAAARAVEQAGYGFPVLFDTDKKVSRLYDPSRLPMTVMIDPHGTIRFIHEGYRRGDEELHARELSKLLAE